MIDIERDGFWREKLRLRLAEAALQGARGVPVDLQQLIDLEDWILADVFSGQGAGGGDGQNAERERPAAASRNQGGDEQGSGADALCSEAAPAAGGGSETAAGGRAASLTADDLEIIRLRRAGVKAADIGGALGRSAAAIYARMKLLRETGRWPRDL